MNEKEQARGLFWCSLLRPLIEGETEDGDALRCLREIAAREHVFPDGQRGKVSVSTLRRKWRAFQKGGFEALARKRRRDRGQSRKHTPEILQRAVELKTEQPFRSDETINQFLQLQFGKQIPKATLYRHLKQAGATRLKLGVTGIKIRCRWTREQTNELWLGDFEEGPYVLYEGQPVRTHLSAFIDCHSRYIVTARYYFRQTLDILIDTLLRAWTAHGASRELYLDNAKVYHADALKAACYALNIKLLHRPPRDPAPGGLIERFFQTVQTQFEAEVRAGDILALDRLKSGLLGLAGRQLSPADAFGNGPDAPAAFSGRPEVHASSGPAAGPGVLPQAGRADRGSQALRRATGELLLPGQRPPLAGRQGPAPLRSLRAAGKGSARCRD